MSLSRRRFLRVGSMMGLAAVVWGGIAPLAFGQSKRELGSGIGTVIPKQVFADPLYNLTSAMFAENLKTRFGFSLGGVKLASMVLSAVISQNPPFVKNVTNGRECFSVVFEGPRSLPLRQDTYTITHSALGTFEC